MRGGNLHADGLACEVFLGHTLDVGVFGSRNAGRRVVIFIGEVDLLLALVRDGHGCDEGVELACLKRRNSAVPFLGNEFALGFHLLAERLGDIDVEAREGAVRVDEVEGRIGAFGADLELEWFFCIGNASSHAADCDCQCCDRCCSGDTLQYAHFQSSRLFWLVP